MIRNILLTFIILSILILSLGFLTPTTEKKEALQLYEDLYLSSRISKIPWNGSVQNCDPGNLNADILSKAENRINYFRKATGLNTIKLIPEYNEKAQYAALMMTANGQISHSPSKNWKCYTEKGMEGAKNSNLGISDFDHFPEISFVTGFILDYGPINNKIGHRKWLLNSRAQGMGYGATGTHEIIYVTGVQQKVANNWPPFIAYPPAGYFPYNLIFEKWSFAIPQGKAVDFRKAKVEMLDDNGKKLAIKILSVEDPWYFDSTIVWQVLSMFSADEIKYVKNSLVEQGYMDKKITIRIKNVIMEGEKTDFEYEVIPFNPGN